MGTKTLLLNNYNLERDQRNDLKKEIQKLERELSTANARHEESHHVHQTLTDELNENTVHIATLNENVNVNDTIINDLKIDLNASTSNLATLEQEHLHLQQLWVHQQPHSNLLQQTGVQHYNMQQHSQSAFTTVPQGEYLSEESVHRVMEAL